MADPTDIGDTGTSIWNVFVCIDSVPGFVYGHEYKNGATSYTDAQENPWLISTGTGAKYSIYATYTPSASDTCTYSGSGDWYINADDNCYITTTTYVTGEVHLQNVGGPGALYIIDGATLAAKKINSTSTPINVEAGSYIKLWTAS